MTQSKPRYIPEGYAPINLNALCQAYGKSVMLPTGSQKFYAIAYVGKQSNPLWHYRFDNEDAAKEKINKLIASLNAHEESKKARRKQRKNALENIKIGDILYYSWGYEQTNIDFFQVVARRGQTMEITPIRGKNVDSVSSMSEYVSPVRDSFCGVPITKRSLSMEFGMLSLTHDGQRHYQSHYA